MMIDDPSPCTAYGHQTPTPNEIGYREHEVTDVINGLGFNQAIEDDVGCECDGFELGFVDYIRLASVREKIDFNFLMI